jgi:signal transduction histidine kinase
LLTNAIKFSPSNSTIILAIEETDNSTKFVVKDYGNSIDKNDNPTLFEKFTQARNEGLSIPSGFGLGLAICKDIIERHGGTIVSATGTSLLKRRKLLRTTLGTGFVTSELTVKSPAPLT